MVALAVWLVSAAIVGVAAMVALYAVAAIVIAILLAVAGPLILLVAPFQIALEGARERCRGRVGARAHVLSAFAPQRSGPSRQRGTPSISGVRD